MKAILDYLLKSKNKNVLIYFRSKNEEKQFYIDMIDKIIAAQSGTDLKQILIKIKSVHWRESGRFLFLLGLLQGALMQYKKDVAIQELNEFFKH